MKPIKLPIIKKQFPILTAQDIVSVRQYPRFYLQNTHEENVPDGFVVVDMTWPCWGIREWLRTQESGKWRESKINHGLSVFLRYIISKDLYTMMVLKFQR